MTFPVPQAFRTRSQQRDDIQWLRALAVLAVVAFHAQLTRIAPGGFVGVDVFFVVSGYLILRGVALEIDRKQRFDPIGFLARRATRILPMLLLVIVTTAVASWFVLGRLDAWSALRDLRAGSLHIANFQLASAPSGYFAPEQASPALHLWSISVEEQFYFTVVVLGALFYRTRRVRGWIIVLGIATVASFVWCLISPAGAAYYFPWIRAWELGVGGLLGFLTRARSEPWQPATIWLGRLVGLSAIAASVILYSSQTPFPGIATVLPVAGAALFIWAGIGSEGRRQQGAFGTAVGRPLRAVGDMSYSLYLWHWPIMVLVAAALHSEIGGWNAAVSIAAALLLSWLTYHLVERPFMNLPVRKTQPKLVIAYGFAAFLVVAAVLTLVMNMIPTSGKLGVGGATASSQTGTSRVVKAPDDALPVDLSPSLKEAGSAPVFDGDCLGVMTLEEKPKCWRGDVSAKRNIVVFGDSHASQFMPALDTIGKERGIRVMPFVLNACPSLTISVDRQIDGTPSTYCNKWRPQQVKDITALNPEMIILSNHVAHYDKLTSQKGDPATLLSTGLNGMLDSLPSSVPVVILSDTPTWDADPVKCLAENVDAVKKCSLPVNHAPLYTAEAYQKLVSNRSNVRVVDTAKLLCADRCYAVQDNMLMYQDTDHLTQVFVNWLTPELERVIFK